MAETKEQLVNIIKDWVKVDNEIRQLQKEMLSRKKEKTSLSLQLIDVMKKNEIDCFDLKDGQLVYTKRSVKKPITKKVLLTILSQ
jgi:5'-3' exonuclease